MTAEINDIVAAASVTRARLAQLQESIVSMIDQIDHTAFLAARDLTQEERTQRAHLSAALSETMDAFQVLGLATFFAISNSATARNLGARMEIVNHRLKDDLDRLRQIAAIAGTVAAIADSLAKIAQALATL